MKSNISFFLSFVFNMKDAIFRVVAAILHIGNIEFSKGQEVDSSVPKDEKSKFHLQTTAELLMYDHLFLIHGVCTHFTFGCFGS